MYGFLPLLLVALSIIPYNVESRDIERELTIEVKPGKEECFFQDVKAGETLDVEYQVVDGGQGNLDINFYIQDGHGNLLVHDVKKADANHRTTMTEDADYKICWDNRISRFNTKTVFFAILIDGGMDSKDGLWDNGFDEAFKASEDYEMTVEEIKDQLDIIRSYLSKSRVSQDQLRAYEARDRNIVENNYSRVNVMSCFNICAMISTGILQVLLVRSLFDEKSKLHILWKKNT